MLKACSEDQNLCPMTKMHFMFVKTRDESIIEKYCNCFKKYFKILHEIVRLKYLAMYTTFYSSGGEIGFTSEVPQDIDASR